MQVMQNVNKKNNKPMIVPRDEGWHLTGIQYVHHRLIDWKANGNGVYSWDVGVPNHATKNGHVPEHIVVKGISRSVKYRAISPMPHESFVRLNSKLNRFETEYLATLDDENGQHVRLLSLTVRYYNPGEISHES